MLENSKHHYSNNWQIERVRHFSATTLSRDKVEISFSKNEFEIMNTFSQQSY